MLRAGIRVFREDLAFANIEPRSTVQQIITIVRAAMLDSSISEFNKRDNCEQIVVGAASTDPNSCLSQDCCAQTSADSLLS